MIKLVELQVELNICFLIQNCKTNILIAFSQHQ